MKGDHPHADASVRLDPSESKSSTVTRCHQPPAPRAVIVFFAPAWRWRSTLFFAPRRGGRPFHVGKKPSAVVPQFRRQVAQGTLKCVPSPRTLSCRPVRLRTVASRSARCDWVVGWICNDTGSGGSHLSMGKWRVITLVQVDTSSMLI